MQQEPLISVVTPVYNAARFLPDLFDAFGAQTLDHARIELVLVDDGSTDDSLAICEAFAAEWSGPSTVLSQENAGQASARNAGLDVARGEWVSFIDADDKIAANFFSALLASAERNPGVLAHASKPLTWDEASGSVANKHPLNFRFCAGDRVVNLDHKPNYTHGHITTTIYNRAHIEAEGLRFDERIHIRFEDGSFVARFLLSCPAPLLALVATTNYIIRVRSDGSSTIQNARFDPRAYTEVPRWGYLGVLEFASDRLGRVPEWAQNLVLYDLLWMMRSSQVEPLRSKVFADEVHDEFWDLLPQVLDYISDETILGFDLMPVPWWMTTALTLRRRGAKSFAPPLIGTADPRRRLISIRYLYVGERPSEKVSVAGVLAEPRYVKDWQLEFMGRPFAWERTIWVSASGIVRLWLDGRLQPLARRWARLSYSDFKIRSADLKASLDRANWRGAPLQFRKRDRSYGAHLRRVVAERVRAIRRTFRRANVHDRLLALAWNSPLVWRMYRNAWVFMDRDVNANDSAEVLYKWVAANHPELKSFFVLRKGTKDWLRLKREGVRLVPYGTLRWRLLMMSAAHFASSHADAYVTNPWPARRYGMPQWTFTFLQHGIIKGDISGWLNQKEIDVFVTSTQDEYDYVSGPGPFKFGTHEVRLTGLPRLDDLLAQDQGVAAEDRRYLLVAPTWRNYLSSGLTKGSARREARDGFMESEFAQAFSGLLTSPALAEAVNKAGLTIAFMPHPNLEAHLPEFDLPDHVTVMPYADFDVRWVIARSVAMITDYSSIAFNMAYVQRPVVYFQFDREDFYGGGHTERPGYFDYDTHGFGPVTETIDGVVAAVRGIIDGTLDRTYFDRMAQTFPVRDGKNSERVFRAMTASRRALERNAAIAAAPPDSWESVTSPR